MATVYSLVCFGGLSGKTVTFTDAGDVVNLTKHGLRQGVTGIVFSSTGSLPTGITAGVTYYPRDGADANKFTIYPTKADALAGTNQVTFTGTGSGTHTVKSAYMLGLTTAQKARYGNPGSERIYSDIAKWQSGITAILLETPDLTSHQVCEIGESFFDLYSANQVIYLNCGSLEITSKVNGVRSEAWHEGDPSKGYTWVHSLGNAACLLNGLNQTVDGINIKVTANNGACIISGALCCFVTAKNNIYQGNPICTGQKGSSIGAPGNSYNNIIINIGGNGIHLYAYSGLGSRYYNNLVTKCTAIGITAEQSSQGLFYNNISVGNATNWGAWCSYTTGCKNSFNFGEPTDKKVISIDYAANANNIVLAGHGRSANLPITFTTSGVLPTVVETGLPLIAGKVYYIRTVVNTNTFTISDTVGGSVLAFSNNGSGTHYTTAIWSNDATEQYIDMTTPNNVFVNYDNNDFRYAGASGIPNAAAIQVENGMDVFGGEAIDILGNVRPNYKSSTYPDNHWDAGPFEFDHGDGLAPAQVNISISGVAEGSVLAIYKTNDGTVIISPTDIGASGSYSITYSYTGDTQIIVVVRKGTSGTKYLPYSAPGLITSNGFSLIVNQVVDGVLNG